MTSYGGSAHAVAGLLLAGGSGSRFGRPKALVDGWMRDRVQALGEGGCEPVLVVLGASADRARALVPAGARTVVAADWAQGMGASLRAGLQAVHGTTADAVLVALVDTPGLNAAAVARVLGARAGTGRAHTVLAQACYDGHPGHPVMIGRSHWDGVVAAAVGDRGGRDYLASRAVHLVECGDVANGDDVDVGLPD